MSTESEILEFASQKALRMTHEKMEEQHWEESEKILSWKEMQTGVYSYHGIEHRGTNDYGRPISVSPLKETA